MKNRFIYNTDKEGLAAGSGDSTNKIMPSLTDDQMNDQPKEQQLPHTQAEDADTTGDLDAGGGTGAEPNASLDDTDPSSVMQEQKETD